MKFYNLNDLKNDSTKDKISVFLRCDLNITDTDFTRVDLSLPTINFLLGINTISKIIICTHLGRPEGKFSKKLSVKNQLLPILQKKISNKIQYINLKESTDLNKLNSDFKTKQIFLLENIRFDDREIVNSPDLVDLIASFSDVYVNDAFGTSHRRHASVYGISKVIKSYAGLLLEKEMQIIKGLFQNKTPNSCLIIGGAKIDDKAEVMMNLITKVDNIIIGGGMVSSFLTNKFPNSVNINLLDSNRDKFIIPEDLVISKEFKRDSQFKIINSSNYDEDMFIVDIGPKSSKKIDLIIQSSKFIVWNGSMGVFEWNGAENGTLNLINSLESNIHAVKYAGGGSTIEAINNYGLKHSFTHISSGGGAFLELLESGSLPALENLKY